MTYSSDPLFDLPPPTSPRGRYHSVRVHGGLAYVSGHLPRLGETLTATGKVGADCSIEDAEAAARVSALCCLSSLARELGSLDAIDKVLKVTGFVASADGFVNQTAIVDAASEAIITRLGPRGEHARSAIGVFQLPRNAPVEIEMICALR